MPMNHCMGRPFGERRGLSPLSSGRLRTAGINPAARLFASYPRPKASSVSSWWAGTGTRTSLTTS